MPNESCYLKKKKLKNKFLKKYAFISYQYKILSK